MPGRKSRSSAASTDSSGAEENDEEVEVEMLGAPFIGPVRESDGSLSKTKYKKYLSVRLIFAGSGSFVCGVGDYVHLRSESPDGIPYVARVLELFEVRNASFAMVQWLYRGRDIPITGLKPGPHEIFLAAKHVDKVSATSIVETFRIELEILGKDNVTRNIRSRLSTDNDSPKKSKLCIYKCSRYYDLLGKVMPLTDDLYEAFERLVDSVSVTLSDDEASSQVDRSSNNGDNVVQKSGKGKDEVLIALDDGESASTRLSKPGSESETSSGSDSDSEDSDSDRVGNKGKRTRRMVADNLGRSSRNVDHKGAASRTRSKAQSSTAKPDSSNRSRVQAVVVDDEHFRKESVEDDGRVASNVRASPLILDLDERLWMLFQEARNEIGTHEALEVLGYLKLEYLYNNDRQPPPTRIAPPPFIRKLLAKPGIRSIVDKSRRVLTLSPVNYMAKRDDDYPAHAVQRAFAQLEICRPGVIFGQLAVNCGDTASTWLFPKQVIGPVFGTVLGRDGFQTCRISYVRQVMRVPITREGTVAQAVVRGFSKLVLPSFAYSLIRTGDFTFEVAQSPDEKCEQIYVRLPTNKTIALNLPLRKALLSFVKLLVFEMEGILPIHQRFLFAGKHIGEAEEDDLPIAQFHIKSASILTLLATQ